MIVLVTWYPWIPNRAYAREVQSSDGLGGGGRGLTATRFAGRKTKPRIVRVLISALSLAAALAMEAWDLLSSCAMRL
jgi:hypothetical protein